MGKAVERLLGNLDNVFEKPGWHMPVTESLQGLTASQAAWAPPGRNSIWLIVDHLSLWKEYVTGLMAGEAPRPQGWEKDIDWRQIQEPTEEGWQAAVRRLTNAQTALKAEVEKRTDEQLEQSLPGGKTPFHQIVQNVVAHDSYHCGQIHYARALQDAPTKW